MKKSDVENNNILKDEVFEFLRKNKLPFIWPKDSIKIIYHYENNMISIPKCYCGKEVGFRSRNKGYRKNCSFYCNVNNPLKINIVKKTKLEKYGDENFNNQSKNKKTKLEKYGDENFNNREKAFKTNKLKYGYHSPMKNEDIKNLSKKTKLERYGNENYNNKEKIVEFWKKTTPEYIQNFIEKNKKTKLERYGNENYNNYQQMIKTKIEKYGYYYNNINKTNLSKKSYFYERNLDRNVKYIKTENNFYYFICDICNKEFSISNTMFSKRCRFEKVICTKCNPKFQSHFESELLMIISEYYKGPILQNVFNIINNYEIDIFLPEISLGIEFNGIYWHSTEYKEKMYHYNKKKMALEKNIDLIFIWEDDLIGNIDSIIDLIIETISIKLNKLTINGIKSCPSDIYISNFGPIKEWIEPFEVNRGGFSVFESGLMILD